MRITLVRNPFEMHRRDVIDVPDICTLREAGTALDIPWDRSQAIHAGRVLPSDEIDTRRFAPDDDVVVKVWPAFIGTAIATAIGFTGTGLKIAAAAINFIIVSAITFGINSLVNALTSQPSSSREKHEDTFGWDGIHNTTANGTPIPLVFGVHKVAGQVLAAHTEAIEDGKNRLRILLGVAAGPISAINGYVTDQDALSGEDAGAGLKLNDNDADLYSDVNVSYRMGAWEQDIIAGFNDSVYVETPIGTRITDVAVPHTTADGIDAVTLMLRCASGLFRMSSTGSFRPYSVTIRARYRRDGAASYGAWTEHTVSAQTKTQYNSQLSIEFPSRGKYELETERVTAADSVRQQSAIDLHSVKEIRHEDVAYQGIALVAVDALATDQISGGMPKITSEVHGAEVRVYQPGDDFGGDTQQNFLAGGNGKKSWGWYAGNTNRATAFSSNILTHRTLTLEHTLTGSAAWDTTFTSPYVYKLVTGDFDVRVRADSTGAAPSGTTVRGGLVVRHTDTSVQNHVVCWRARYAADDIWRAYAGSTTDGSTNASGAIVDVSYYRITRIGTQFTWYYSADGSAWTQLRQETRTALTGEVQVGLILAAPTTTGSPYIYDFRDFEFADTTAHSIECTRNPAWVIHHLLTDEDHGLGAHIDTTEIDIDEFCDFASYCNEATDDGVGGTERKHLCDIIIDAVRPAWERIQEIARNARASIVRHGNRIRPIWQAPRDAVQVFGVSNIKSGTMRVSYQSEDIGANLWEVQYLNAERDWEVDWEQWTDPDLDADTPYRRESTSHYGVTRRSEALRECRFWARSRCLSKTCSFEAGSDALACEPGDRVDIQWDTTGWGVAGGRATGGTTSTIALDHAITLASGVTYEIKVRHSDDTIDTRTVSTPAGRAQTLNVTPDFTAAPADGDVYAIGATGYSTSPWTVASITRTGDNECRLELVEYDEDLFDDTLSSLPQKTYTSLPNPYLIPSDVTNLLLTERAQIERDGTIRNVIDVSYSLPSDADSVDIWYREDDVESWQYAGRYGPGHGTISHAISYGFTYVVAVAAVSPMGARKAPAAAPQAIITVYGRTDPPSDVTNLRVVRHAETLYLRWDPVDDPDLYGYEVRYGASAWASATLLATNITESEFNTTNFAAGQQYFQVKAINTSGIYSTNAASIQQTIEGRLNENLVIERDEGDEGWDGTKTDMTVSTDYLDLDADELTGSYVTPEIDVGASVRSVVAVRLISTQVDRSMTWAAATFTWESATALATAWAGEMGSEHLTITLEWRYGNTSGVLGDYATFLPGQYTFRYCQFRVSVEVDDTQYGCRLEEMVSLVDVPDYTITIKDQAIADTGTTITWADHGPGFNVVPTVAAVVVGGAAGDTVRLSSKGASTVVVHVSDSTFTYKAGTVDIIAQGY